MPGDYRTNKVYRVEFWDERINVIDRLKDVFPQFRTLDPFVSRLVQDGAEGEVVLIDEETNEVVARRKVLRRKNGRTTVG